MAAFTNDYVSAVAVCDNRICIAVTKLQNENQAEYIPGIEINTISIKTHDSWKCVSFSTFF